MNKTRQQLNIEMKCLLHAQPHAQYTFAGFIEKKKRRSAKRRQANESSLWPKWKFLFLSFFFVFVVRTVSTASWHDAQCSLDSAECDFDAVSWVLPRAQEKNHPSRWDVRPDNSSGRSRTNFRGCNAPLRHYTMPVQSQCVMPPYTDRQYFFSVNIIFRWDFVYVWLPSCSLLTADLCVMWMCVFGAIFETAERSDNVLRSPLIHAQFIEIELPDDAANHLIYVHAACALIVCHWNHVVPSSALCVCATFDISFRSNTVCNMCYVV